MTPETEQKLKDIKRSFRLMMNGPASQSMRQRGLDYHLNWGVPYVELKAMACACGKDYDLAIALWKEDIRECKLLATMVMPPERMVPEVADLWMEQATTQELAEMLAFNLLQHVDYAPLLAYRWIAADAPLYQIAGYTLLGRLFMKGQEPNELGINEFLDQAATAVAGDHAGVRHAAANCLRLFAQMGEVYRRLAGSALRRLGGDGPAGIGGEAVNIH